MFNNPNLNTTWELHVKTESISGAGIHEWGHGKCSTRVPVPYWRGITEIAKWLFLHRVQHVPGHCRRLCWWSSSKAWQQTVSMFCICKGLSSISTSQIPTNAPILGTSLQVPSLPIETNIHISAVSHSFSWKGTKNWNAQYQWKKGETTLRSSARLMKFALRISASSSNTKMICVVRVTKPGIYFCFPVLHTIAENGKWNQKYAAYWKGLDGIIWLNTGTSGAF
jgi:hypothetical protein